MSNVQKFKKLARLRLREGRLIKTTNEYELDHAKIQHLKSKDDEIENIILRHLVYVSFDHLLHLIFTGFQKFLARISGEPYALLFKQDRNKSDVWIIMLLLRYGRQFLGKTYYDPINVINISADIIDTSAKHVNYMLVDDFIFTGTQMNYTLDHLSMKLQYNLQQYKIHVLCGGIGRAGLAKLSSWGVNIHYAKKYASLGQLVKKSPHSANYTQYKAELSQKFGQPFIDPVDYMNNIPIYFEHKIPDVMSSFPHIIIQVAKNCKWDENTDINDGSSQHTPCGTPFYKIVNESKGKSDSANEKKYMKQVVQTFKRLPPPSSPSSSHI